MPDRKGTGTAPTEDERESVFAPHESPDQQADGDPGAEKPKPEHIDQADAEKVASDKPSQ